MQILTVSKRFLRSIPIALLAFSLSATAQQQPTVPAETPATVPAESHLTPEQAKELFRSVDEILKFASEDTGLAQKQSVKRRLINREEVEKYLLDKIKSDPDTKRAERSEVVLKKFGLIDRDFRLQPFLISLLKEQIAGYYDSKTRTVNLLDWIEPNQQKEVLAHELTHALQDQRVRLEKWNNPTSITLPKNSTDDNQYLNNDEVDDTREAVLEGQAMAVFIDYSLRPMGKTLLTAPDLVATMKEHMSDAADSPVMARAPLLLQQSLIFPYREGLGFIQKLLTDRGKQAAFAGVLDNPPSTSWEILNPDLFEQGKLPPHLRIPDIHPLLGTNYTPYDLGAVGQLDLRILATLYGGEELSQHLTPAWDGGYYYAAQIQSDAAKKLPSTSTATIATLYLSAWKSEQTAQSFAAMYADNIARKYSGVVQDEKESTEDETIWQTAEGPVMIVVHGKQVFISESFDLATARKLELVTTGLDASGDTKTTMLTIPNTGLSDGLARLFENAGMMRVALPK
jgi:hypothetical protein